jgi:hypothetical protein
MERIFARAPLFGAYAESHGSGARSFGTCTARAFAPKIIGMMTTLMLMMIAASPKPELSPVLQALFAHEPGTELRDAKTNPALKEVLAKKPKLDFYETAAVGNARDLDALLKTDPALRDRFHPLGWNALHLASFAGNVENVKLLLDRGADVHVRAKTKFQNTPLLISLLTGQRETAQLLLERGASALERQALGFSPLHEAALLGRADLVELLLAHGAELEARTNDGRTPLTEALRAKQHATAELLRSKGAVEVAMTEALMKPPK